jgi:type II secretory pathway pseudopilin PulG
MRRSHAREQGMTLVETVLAMLLMTLVFTTVATSVNLLAGTSNSLGQQARAIDQLQLAEQTIVRDVHAATCATALTIPTCLLTVANADELEFTADLNGGTQTVEFLINTTTDNLTVSKNGGNPVTIATTLNPTASSFNALTATWTVGSPSVTYSYQTMVQVTLVKDSPAVSAHAGVTTVSDPSIEVWNIEDSCQSAWQQDPPNVGTTDQC